jgi:hypothetical protein
MTYVVPSGLLASSFLQLYRHFPTQATSDHPQQLRRHHLSSVSDRTRK